MRFVLTSCWHLGHRLHGRDVLGERARALRRLPDVAREVGADAVLVAGDVHDASPPSAEAVAAADEALVALVGDAGVPAIVLVGDRDEAPVLPVGRRLLARSGLHLVDAHGDPARPIELKDDAGPVHVHAIPQGLQTGGGLADAVRRAAAARRDDLRSVLLLHGPIDLSAGEVAAAVAGFDLVVVGHAPRAADLLSDRLQSPGPPWPLDLADADASRSLAIVDLAADGRVTSEPRPLPDQRGLRSLTGSLADVLGRAQDDPAPEDWLLVRLTDPELLPGAARRVREVHPNALVIDRVGLRPDDDTQPCRPATAAATFEGFARRVRGAGLDPEERAVLGEVLEGLGLARGEVP